MRLGRKAGHGSVLGPGQLLERASDREVTLTAKLQIDCIHGRADPGAPDPPVLLVQRSPQLVVGPLLLASSEVGDESQCKGDSARALLWSMTRPRRKLLQRHQGHVQQALFIDSRHANHMEHIENLRPDIH